MRLEGFETGGMGLEGWKAGWWVKLLWLPLLKTGRPAVQEFTEAMISALVVATKIETLNISVNEYFRVSFKQKSVNQQHFM